MSKAFAGNDVSDEQLYQEKLKLIPLLVSNKGNDVKLEQPNQEKLKSVPLLVLINGNDVNDEQPSQAALKLIPLLVSINGNDVNDEQRTQAWKRLVTFSKCPISVALITIFEQPQKAFSWLVLPKAYIPKFLMSNNFNLSPTLLK